MKRGFAAEVIPTATITTRAWWHFRRVTCFLLLSFVSVTLSAPALGECRGGIAKLGTSPMCTPGYESGRPRDGDDDGGGGGCSGEDCPQSPGEVFFGVDKDGRRARAENAAGVSAWKRGDYVTALKHFEHAARYKPRDRDYATNVNLARAMILVNAANAAQSRGDYREALRLGRELARVPGADYNPAWLSWLESQVIYQDASKLWDQGKLKEALVLYRKAAKNPDFGDAEWREWLENAEARVQRHLRSDKAEKERKAARERNLPKANRLNDESVTLLQRGDADTALKRLDAARELVSDDSRINANWYIAKASIAHRNGQLDVVIANLEQAVQQDPSNAAAHAALDKARSERAREAENIRHASATTLGRLRNTSSDRPASTAGEQLARTEPHSRDASKLDREPSASEAQAGFDRAATKTGATLVYPAISGRSPSLALTIPAAGRDDPVVKDMLAWHDRLEAMKADIDKQIEAIKEQQNARKDPILAVKIDSLSKAKEQHSIDQATAKEKIGTRLKNLSIGWDEAGETDTSASPNQANQLEFIAN